MKEEIEAAALWWVRQLEKTTSNRQALEIFKKTMEKIMQERYTGHWYEEDRARGSAYRSISYDNRMDPIILMSAKTAGIESIEEHLEQARHKIMFVNPGEVKVTNAVLLSAPAQHIWQRKTDTSSTNGTHTTNGAGAGGAGSKGGSGGPRGSGGHNQSENNTNKNGGGRGRYGGNKRHSQ